MTDRPDIEALPTLRAKCGYVCKYATVHAGELTPGLVVSVLDSKGLIDDSEDAEAIAADVVANFGGEA